MPTQRTNIIRKYGKVDFPTKKYLTFTSADNTCMLSLYSVGMPNEIFLEYTLNGITWQPYTFTTVEDGETTEHREGEAIVLLGIGASVQFRARKHSVNGTVLDYNTSWANFSGSNNNEPTGYYRWSFSNDVYASGNIQSLIKHNARINTIYQGAYFKMFLDCTQLLSAPYLGGGKSTNLNDDTCQDRCYCYMFAGCTNIEEVEFPEWLTCGTHHGQFYNMFYGCSKLKHVSDIRIYANNYQNNVSCKSMFENCTSMVIAPKILITNSAGNRNMGDSTFYKLFKGCTSLVDASLVDTFGYPNVPFYQDWSECFANCTSLKKTKFLFNPVNLGANGVHDFFNSSGIEEIRVEPYILNGYTKVWENLCKNCSSLKKIVFLDGNLGKRWSNATYTADDGTITDYLNTKTWVYGVAASGDFFCTNNRPKIFSPHFIPEKWKVYRTKFNDWLCFTAKKANSTIRLDKVGSPDPVRLETSTDGSTWTEYTWDGATGATITLASVGDKVYWRAVTKNKTFSTSEVNVYRFRSNDIESIYCSGSILSLLDRYSSVSTIPAYAFYYLFANSNFLVNAPAIPEIPLEVGAMYRCFKNQPDVKGDIVIPDIKNANSYSLREIFEGTGITSVDCRIASLYFTSMLNYSFRNCTSLNKIKLRIKSWGSYGFKSWVDGVATSGTFVCHPDLDTTQRDESHVPVRWMVKTFAQDACDTYSDIAALVQAYPALADVINDHPDIVEKLHKYNGLVHSLVNTGYKPYMQCHGDRYEIKDTEGCLVYPYTYMSAKLNVSQVTANDEYGIDARTRNMHGTSMDKCNFTIENINNGTISAHRMIFGDATTWRNPTVGNGSPMSIGNHEFYLSNTSMLVDGIEMINSPGYKADGFMTNGDGEYVNPKNLILGFSVEPIHYNDSKFYSLVIKCWEGTADEETWCHIVPVADGVMANIADLDNIQFMQGTLQPQAVDDPTTYESRSSVFGLETIQNNA